MTSINNIKRYKSIVCIFIFLTNCLYAQQKELKNLIPNSSFENFRKKSTSIKAAIPWTQIASVDYYQDVIKNDTTSEKGARTGNCYAGLRFQKKYKEFLQVRLAEPLHRSYKYQFEVYIRLAYWSNATLRSFGAYFGKAGFKNSQQIKREFTVDSIAKKGSLDGNFHWFKITGVYTAEGGEKYITIGNFSTNINKDLVRDNIFRFNFKEAYYFIDDIALYQMKMEEQVKTVIVGSETYEKDSVLQVKADIKVGERVDLKNIHFEKSHSYITPESYLELNKLVQYLFRNPNMEIRINGYSDNSGSSAKNLKLSEARARIVFEYLITKGVQNKMYFKGFGSKSPIASNETEEGKAKNRRVEFEIIKQN